MHRHSRWHKSKGKGHQMNLKMINADWDRHTLALPPLHSQKWALRRPPPSFGRRWDCQIGLPVTLLASREVLWRRRVVGGWEDRAYWRGVMEVEEWKGTGNGAESLNLINEWMRALCPLCLDSVVLFWLFRARKYRKHSWITVLIIVIINWALFLLSNCCNK